MDSYRMNTSAPNMACICIDKTEKLEYSGRIYHRYSREAIPFQNSTQMIMVLNRFFDDINYPQSSTIYRSLNKGKKAAPDGASRKTPPPDCSSEWVMEHKGERKTIFLQVQYRQNSTWQGRVVWQEGGKAMIFSSVLELLRILNQFI